MNTEKKDEASKPTSLFGSSLTSSKPAEEKSSGIFGGNKSDKPITGKPSSTEGTNLFGGIKPSKENKSLSMFGTQSKDNKEDSVLKGGNAETPSPFGGNSKSLFSKKDEESDAKEPKN